jgi:hypothetical protein
VTGSLHANLQFEDSVRRAAEAIWRLDPGQVQPAWYRNDPILRELDGIARLPEVTHLLMVTTSTRLRKVEEDVEKLLRAERAERQRGANCKMWLITELQLNAEHIDHARRNNVETITFAQFRNRFFNSYDYLQKRRTYPFGSARNLRDGGVEVPTDEYAALPMEAIRHRAAGLEVKSVPEAIDVKGICTLLEKGEAVVLAGPFGAGKSLTTREVFFLLERKLSSQAESGVPVTINLREHWGAIYGDEVLERHARSLALSPREAITAAWRAGFVHLLLDGFDEVATQALAQSSDRNFLRRTRYEALQAVRDLIQNAPSGVGVLCSGRGHYFDTVDELRNALGLTSRSLTLITLGEFTEEAAQAFLKKHGKSTTLPDWLPRKPLLLGYLAHQGLLEQVLAIDHQRGFGHAWDNFLDLVCRREAEHPRATIDPTTIRQVLEYLSCISRCSLSGSGAVTGPDLAAAYTFETGGVPGEGVLMQLQRLPGLTPREQDPTARSFIDEDFLAALQGGAVARAVLGEPSRINFKGWKAPLTRQGVRMAAYLLDKSGLASGTVVDVARRASRESKSNRETSQLISDLLMCAVELCHPGEKTDGRGIEVSGAAIAEIDLEEHELTGVSFRDCHIDSLFVGESPSSSIQFIACTFGRVHGATGPEALPPTVFRDCLYDSFDNASTNAAILKLPIQPSLKALLTTIRKLYLQAGGGRKLAALKRGMPGGGVIQGYVDPVLRLLEAEGMVAIEGDVAHPIRKNAARALKIIAENVSSTDSVVEKARSLQ